MKKLIALMIALAMVLACVSALAEREDVGVKPAIVEVEGGKIMGFTMGDVTIFKGIPYAEAERFEMPRPTKWNDIRACLNFSEVCPQGQYSNNANDFASVSNYFVEDREENTFLTVNVWTKNLNPDKPKPVLFWIHGGGYSSGSSCELELYDGYNLTEFGDIVFVSVNHRLNYLGYLDLSAYGEDYKYTANLGHADLIAALEWVQRNIAIFGGDPNNVTIEGQSGGGTKVTQLMGMPAAQGLFHKAVCQSGGSVKVTRTTEQAQAQTAVLVENLGLAGKSNEEIIAFLKAMPYDDLAAACREAKVGAGATVDGDYYPTGTYELSADKPVIFSTVLGEMSTQAGQLTGKVYPKYLTEEHIATHYSAGITDEAAMARITELYGDRAEEVAAAYQAAYPGHPISDLLYTTGRNNDKAVAMAGLGNPHVYQCVQAYDPPYFGWTTAQHTAGDIPYWFRTVINTDARFMIFGDEECGRKVMDEMSQALVNFCYTGDPSTEALPWAPFTVENGETMIFDRVSEVRNYHDKAYFELINEINAAK
ncbi:MAG: carboxylesterase/lipase family protein [Clostridia bacterium]|nr:carboxylesterase/lipase family protein [Clostridia bacterium]